MLWFLRRKRHRDPTPTKVVSRPPLYVSLGVDFGTRYTKIAWRDVVTEEAGIIGFGSGSTRRRMIPSWVAVDENGVLMICGDSIPEGATRVNFLKMHLSGTPLTPMPPAVRDEIQDPAAVLCAFFLARVMCHAREAFASNHRHLTKDRPTEWFPRVGMPTAQFASPLRHRFEDIARTAWTLSRAMETREVERTPTLKELDESLSTITAAADDDAREMEAYPEIGASVLAFLSGPSAVPGVYIYFDIGGGTLDGVAFRYDNVGGDRRVEYLAAQVEPLGFDAVVRSLRSQTPDTPYSELRETIWRACNVGQVSVDMTEAEVRVQKAVASVVAGGRGRDRRDWHREPPQTAIAESIYAGREMPRPYEELIVFLGGGGCRCRIYRHWIEQAHGAFQHRRIGIPRYALKPIQPSSAFRLPSDISKSYYRLSVAFGLTVVPTTALRVTGAPNQPAVEVAVRRFVDFDARAVEGYGETV